MRFACKCTGRWVLVALFLVVCLEIMAFIALALWYRDFAPMADVWAEQERIAGANAQDLATFLKQEQENRSAGKPAFIESDREVLHPYLGFVHDTTVPRGTGAYYGFTEAPAAWIHSKKENEITVGIFGGSVANYFYFDGGGELVETLKTHPPFAGKTLKLVLFALAGYKQPQQLMVLNYYLSLGGHLDIAVNLDGFNELVLPAYENIPKGVFPFYPRSWFFRVPSEENRRLLPIRGQISYLQQRRSELAMRLRSIPLRYSATAGLLWKVVETYFARKIARHEQALLAFRPQEAAEYVITGPHRVYGSQDEMVGDVVDHWGRNSLLMDRVSRANGIEYFHFLQPTGRFMDSKPLTDEERTVVFAGTFPPTDLVNAGYPLLRKKGEGLRASAVRFTDLSMIFRETRESLYFDVAHVTKEGSTMMARAIADVITQEFEEKGGGRRE